MLRRTDWFVKLRGPALDQKALYYGWIGTLDRSHSNPCSTRHRSSTGIAAIALLAAWSAGASVGCRGPSREPAPPKVQAQEDVEPKAPAAPTEELPALAPSTADAGADTNRVPPVVYPPFDVPRKCAENVEVGPTMGVDYPSASREGEDPSRFETLDATPFRDTIVRLVSPAGVESSRDGGKTWSALNAVGFAGSRRITVDKHGNLWVISYNGAVVSADGTAWKRVVFPPLRPGASVAYSHTVMVDGEPWVHSRTGRLLLRLSASSPPESWRRVVLPGEERRTDFELAAVGSTFVGLGSDDRGAVSTVFDGQHSEEVVIGPDGGGAISCAGAGCVGVAGSDVVARQELGKPWTSHGTLLDLAKWNVAHCKTASLGNVASLIRRGRFREDNPIAFTMSIWGFVFDGHSVVASLGVAENNGPVYDFVLVLGPEGIAVRSTTGNRLALLERGKFWLFEVRGGIVPLTVRYGSAGPAPSPPVRGPLPG
jgi:hypothetical protein